MLQATTVVLCNAGSFVFGVNVNNARGRLEWDSSGLSGRDDRGGGCKQGDGQHDWARL